VEANPAARTEADLRWKPEDVSPGPLDSLPNQAADPERAEIARQEIERIRGYFRDDTLEPISKSLQQD
jgi:hypothetical protein